MKTSKMIFAVVALISFHISSGAEAAQTVFCTDGLRTVELGQKGLLTARGFVNTLGTAKSSLKCRPDGNFAGLGVWQAWFNASLYKCTSKETLIRASLTRAGFATSLQITNAYGFLIFNGYCHVQE